MGIFKQDVEATIGKWERFVREDKILAPLKLEYFYSLFLFYSVSMGLTCLVFAFENRSNMHFIRS